MADFFALWKGRSSVRAELEAQLAEATADAPLAHQSCINIQRLFRGQYIRIVIAVKRAACIVVQRVFRGFQGRRVAAAAKQQLVAFQELAVYHYHCAVVQRTFRGYYSRRYLHDFSARRKYITAIKVRGDELRATLAQHHANLVRADEERAEDEARAEFEKVTQNLHHLVSTAAVPGVYNSPYVPEPPTALGLPIEDHLRASVSQLLRSRGYTKRGLVSDLGGSRKVPVRPPHSRLSVQATSRYEVVEEQARIDAKLNKMSRVGGAFVGGSRVADKAYKRGCSEGAPYKDPWRNPYLIRGIPTSQAELRMERTTLGKAPAVHFHTSVGGNKSATLPNDRFDVILDAETSGGVLLRHKHTSTRFGVADTCDVEAPPAMFPPLVPTEGEPTDTGMDLPPQAAPLTSVSGLLS